MFVNVAPTLSRPPSLANGSRRRCGRQNPAAIVVALLLAAVASVVPFASAEVVTFVDTASPSSAGATDDASIQVVKVEIGLGDDDGESGLDVLKEKIEMNPDIITYANLPPLKKEPVASEMVNLVVARMEKAKKEKIEFNYLGLPPPRDDHDASMFNPFFAKLLRAWLDMYGFTGTKLVARSAPGVYGGDVEGVCNMLQKEPEYATAIYAVATKASTSDPGNEGDSAFKGCKVSSTKIWYTSSPEEGGPNSEL